jgi:hypothetical protein
MSNQARVRLFDQDHQEVGETDSDRSAPPRRNTLAVMLVFIGLGATIVWAALLAWAVVKLVIFYW